MTVWEPTCRAFVRRLSGNYTPELLGPLVLRHYSNVDLISSQPILKWKSAGKKVMLQVNLYAALTFCGAILEFRTLGNQTRNRAILFCLPPLYRSARQQPWSFKIKLRPIGQQAYHNLKRHLLNAKSELLDGFNFLSKAKSYPHNWQ